MKRIIFLMLSVVLSSSLIAQEFNQTTPINKKGYIGISIGAAIPVGELGSTDINSDYSGFAKTGLSIQLVNFGYRFGKNIGIAAMWSGASFIIDEDALRKNAGLGSVYMETDPWGFGSLMGGILISIPSQVLDVDFRGMIGLGYGVAPQMKLSGFDSNGYLITVLQESADAYAFAYDFGIGLRFNVSRLINLNLFMDYVGCKPKFSIALYGDGMYLGTSEFEQPMNHMTITGGIGFRLN